MKHLLPEDPSLVERLRDLGVREGSVVYTATDLSRLPLCRLDPSLLRDAAACRERWLAWVHASLRSAIGPEGTLVVPTFSYDYARNHTPFVHEASPSEVCRFSEFVRTRPGAVRSLHPLFSLTAVGPRAEEICGDVGRSAYGARSAFARLLPADATFVFLGAPLRESLTYVHHLEHLYGVNHYMHKAFDAPVQKEGAIVPGPWFAFVRYLGCGIDITVERLERHLRDRGLLAETTTSRGVMQLARCADVHREGLACLDADPWFFIDEPRYVRFRQENLKIFDAERPTTLVGFCPEREDAHVSS